MFCDCNCLRGFHAPSVQADKQLSNGPRVIILGNPLWMPRSVPTGKLFFSSIPNINAFFSLLLSPVGRRWRFVISVQLESCSIFGLPRPKQAASQAPFRLPDSKQPRLGEIS